VFLFVLIAFLIIFGFFWVRLRPTNFDASVMESNGSKLKTINPDPVLLKLSDSAADAHDLLDGEFSTSGRVSEINGDCMSAFESSFVKTDGTALSGKVDVADPGQPFQFSDALAEGLPFRQLVLAGMGSKSCFIYYQHGGRMYPSYCLAVMDLGMKKAVWVGESNKKAGTIEELRSELRRRQFSDSTDAGC
jgi:hypothetical protein